MDGTMTIPAYKYLGTFTDTPELTIRAASEEDSDHLLIVNRVTHSGKTKRLFRELFFYSSEKPEHSDFVELFNIDQDFFAVFKYYQAPSLTDLYGSGEGSTSTRLQVLIAALLRVNGNLSMPHAVVCSLLQPQNILVGDSGAIHLSYRLESDFLDTHDQLMIWRQAASLLQFMLKKELSSSQYKQLKNIYKKCLAGLYSSFSELISDLKKSIEGLHETGLFYSVKQSFLSRKAALAQITWLGSAVLLVFFAIYLVDTLSNADTVPVISITDIGNITYVAAQGEKDNSVKISESSSSGSGPAFLNNISPDTKLNSEDYIVQPEDTLASICSKKYGAAAYEKPVAAFNGLAQGENPEAGAILRLPSKDQLSAFIAK